MREKTQLGQFDWNLPAGQPTGTTGVVRCYSLVAFSACKSKPAVRNWRVRQSVVRLGKRGVGPPRHWPMWKTKQNLHFQVRAPVCLQAVYHCASWTNVPWPDNWKSWRQSGMTLEWNGCLTKFIEKVVQQVIVWNLVGDFPEYSRSKCAKILHIHGISRWLTRIFSWVKVSRLGLSWEEGRRMGLLMWMTISPIESAWAFGMKKEKFNYGVLWAKNYDAIMRRVVVGYSTLIMTTWSSLMCISLP